MKEWQIFLRGVNEWEKVRAKENIFRKADEIFDGPKKPAKENIFPKADEISDLLRVIEHGTQKDPGKPANDTVFEEAEPFVVFERKEPPTIKKEPVEIDDVDYIIRDKTGVEYFVIKRLPAEE